MRAALEPAATTVLAAVGGGGICWLLAYLPYPYGAGGVGFLICSTLFVLWPWAVVPVGIVGSTFAAVLAGQSDVKSIVLVHLAVLTAGAVAVIIRRLFGLDRDLPVHHFFRVSMVMVLAITAIGAMYGVVLGNTIKNVVTATYQIAVIPLYFLITLYTLNTARFRRNAALLYVLVIGALTALEMVSPGRHGGLLSLLPVPMLVLYAGRLRGWRRCALALSAAGLTADVVLSSYRGVWIAAGISIVIMSFWVGRDFVQGLIATAVAGTVLLSVLLVGLYSGLANRFSVVVEAFGRGAGYRVPEASVGWQVFLSRPLFGAGLGQSTPDIYIPGFAVTDVGPVYHSYYIVILANLGLIGLIAVLWPIVNSVRAALGRRARPVGHLSIPVAMASLTCGFLASALVEGPTDGHWELGLLPALTLLTLPGASPATPRPLLVAGANPRTRPDVRSTALPTGPAVAATAIVVTYNSAGLIAATLTALNSADLEIIVVDNDSDDRTTAIIARDFPGVHLIANESNEGFAVAVNRALALVQTPVLMLVNPDCTVPCATTRGLLDFLTVQSGADLVAPRLVDPEGRVAVSAHPFESLRSVLASRFGGSAVPVGIRLIFSGRDRRRAYVAVRRPDGPTRVDWVSGACLAVRTEVLRDIGGLDGRYFLYYEDEELCWQIGARSGGVFYLPAVTATHVGGASSGSGDTWPHLYRSMLIFFALHRPTSYQAVRAAVLLRAGIGITMGCVRTALRGDRGSGPARIRAWWRVARVAITFSSSSLHIDEGSAGHQRQVPA